MPSEKGDKEAVTIWVDKSLVARIEKLAKKAGISRSQLITNILRETVGPLESLNALGVWATTRVFRDFGERMWKAVKEWKTVMGLKSKV
jgi:hypothetical protein